MATIASYYARPPYALLCAEELLKSGEPAPGILLPDDNLFSTLSFFSDRAQTLSQPGLEAVQRMERVLTVRQADRLVVDKSIADRLPGMDPVEFVHFALMEELGMLDREKGFVPELDSTLRLALVNGYGRFNAIYDYALLRES